jgi:hypothetical protein
MALDLTAARATKARSLPWVSKFTDRVIPKLNGYKQMPPRARKLSTGGAERYQQEAQSKRRDRLAG